jgi:hypothetical protein
LVDVPCGTGRRAVIPGKIYICFVSYKAHTVFHGDAGAARAW